MKRLAASLAAEEEKSFTEGAERHFTSVPFQEGDEIDEDEGDDEEMIFVSLELSIPMNLLNFTLYLFWYYFHSCCIN